MISLHTPGLQRYAPGCILPGNAATCGVTQVRWDKRSSYCVADITALPVADLVPAILSKWLVQEEKPTFVRVLLLRGKMVGAVLIGETELEEVFENLILDGLDLSSYGPALLDPSMEIDHMFD